MNILIDIGHPAHVHLFRNYAKLLLEAGHRVLFTTRDKEVAIHLLKHYGFDYVSCGKPYKKVWGKLWGLVKFDFQLLRAALRFKPHLFLSAGSFYAAHTSFLTRKPHITFEDTGNMEQMRLYLPFSEAVMVPSVYHKEILPRMVPYNGYHELAYLHPHRYSPDESILEELGVTKNEKYVIIRFVSWSASHDRGQGGFPLEQKIRLVRAISEHARVFISSEGELPSQLEAYRVRISPERMHDAMAFASLYIGEGATMASECAMLGTPAIYVNSITAGTLEDQEKYGLLYGFRNADGVQEKALEILGTPNIKTEWQKKRDIMLADKIDVTEFMHNFIKDFATDLHGHTRTTTEGHLNKN